MGELDAINLPFGSEGRKGSCHDNGQKKTTLMQNLLNRSFARLDRSPPMDTLPLLNHGRLPSMLRFFFLLVILLSAWSCAASSSEEVDTNDVGMPLPQSPGSNNTQSPPSNDVSTAPQMEEGQGSSTAGMNQMQPMPDTNFSFPDNMARRFAE